MYARALTHLACPRDGRALKLDAFVRDGDWIEEGVLRDEHGHWYPIIDGLPVFPSAALTIDLATFAERHGLEAHGASGGGSSARGSSANGSPAGHGGGEDGGQSLTNETFSDKWRRFKSYGLEPSHETFLQGWYAKKFGLAGPEHLPGFFAPFEHVLEAGPGSGFNSCFMARHVRGEVFALDISDAARTTLENGRALPNLHAVNADLFGAPFPDNHFDFVIADGVLHHTPSTRGAMESLYRKVKPGGRYFFYVYKRMGALRAFADAHVRAAFTKLSPEDCYAACEAITDLGRALSGLKASVTLERPIDVLGIPAGTHDVQRLIYYNVLKCFWNDAFDYETNNMVNFDWYHPHHAWQHDEDEVRGWLADLGVRDYAIHDANPNGISVLLTKPL